MNKKRKFPEGSNFINKENAEYWAKRSGHHYRITKGKSGFRVNLGKKKK